MFSSDLIFIYIPSLSHSFLHRYKPIPVDLIFVLPVFPVYPFLNTLFISLGLIPMPLSFIVNPIVFFSLKPIKDKILSSLFIYFILLLIIWSIIKIIHFLSVYTS